MATKKRQAKDSVFIMKETAKGTRKRPSTLVAGVLGPVVRTVSAPPISGRRGAVEMTLTIPLDAWPIAAGLIGGKATVTLSPDERDVLVRIVGPKRPRGLKLDDYFDVTFEMP